MSLKIIFPREHPAGLKLDKKAVRTSIKAYYTSVNQNARISERLKNQQKAKELLVMRALSEVILPQLGSSWHLNLNDGILGDCLGLTPRQAQHLRLLMKAMGLIFFPPETKQKKKGDYPHWMLRHTFLIFPEAAPKPKRVVKNRKYVAQYYVLWDQAKRETYAWLSEYDAVMLVQTYMGLCHQRLDEILAAQGLERKDFLK